MVDPVLCDALQQKGAVLPEQMAWAQLMERLVFITLCNGNLLTASTWHILL